MGSGGFHNLILHICLTDGSVRQLTPGEPYYRRYVGGGLLGTVWALKLAAHAHDPLSPGNVLVLAPGVLTGAPISGLGRHGVVTRSPMTGGILDSQAGGYWGAGLKLAGVDALVITGRAPHPVYILVQDGAASIIPADHLWGQGTGQATRTLLDELGEPGPVRVAAIGPAGENMVRFASITCDLRHTHGRGGAGAVMGSKRLKAIAVRATGAVPVADPTAVKRLAAQAAAAKTDNPMVQELARQGSAGALEYQNAAGGLPTRNWQAAEFAGASRIDAAALDRIVVRRGTCHACSVRCKRVVSTGPPYEVDPEFGGPEYETLAALGSYLELDDLEAIAKFHQLANDLGMDTISLGGTLAMAMECVERGLWPEFADDPVPRFGSVESVLDLIPLIAARRGVGDLLALGAMRAAEVIGGAAPGIAMHVRGLELPAHMPQAKGSLALIYTTSPLGADHISSEHDEAYFPGAPPPALRHLRQLGLAEPRGMEVLDSAKFRFALTTHIYYSLLDSLPACIYCWGPLWLYSPLDLAAAVAAVTGWDTSLYELMLAGERRLALMHAFNHRAGLKPAAARLPARFYSELPAGSPRAAPLDADELGRWQRLLLGSLGVDPLSGRVHSSKLTALGLEWVDSLP